MDANARNICPVRILGSTVNMVDIDFVVNWMEARIRGFDRKKDTAAQLLVTGFHGLNQARKDQNYFRIGQACDLWVPDSIAPVMVARMRGMKDAVRTPGAEIMDVFFRRANKRGYSSYFYGDADHTLVALKQKLENRYPGHRFAGAFSPPFRPLGAAEEQEHVDMINEARPDVLWVGLGLPKQDEWIYRCRDRLKVPVAAGVGAAFGFLAETVKRAPAWARRMHLEWACMMVKKPKRTGRRVLIEGSEFMWHLLREELQRAKMSLGG